MHDRLTAKKRYEQLRGAREPYLKRGRKCARLTIPALLPEAGHSGAAELPCPWQGMGARGLNNLSAKLLLALFPPNASFFRLTVDDQTREELSADEKLRGEMEETLASIERTVMTELETSLIRGAASEALKLLLVSGNVLVYLDPDGGMKVWRLDKYVVKRDPKGHVLEILVHEQISKQALPKETRSALERDPKYQEDTKNPSHDVVNLYTWIRRDGERFVVHQEAEDVFVEGSEGHYPLSRTPWLALRYTKMDGEDYGRGHVEEYSGDLGTLDTLSQAIAEGTTAAVRVLLLVHPNGNTLPEDLQNARNLDILSGSRDDVTTLQVEKSADLRVALETCQVINTRLAHAFLLNASVQRNAERVTAEEVRLMASELEDALGGVYSILSQEFQLPLVTCLMHHLQKKRRLPHLPEKHIKPLIITGMEALGRGHDLNRLMTFGQIIQNTLGPEGFHSIINSSDFITRVGTGLGIEMKGLVKSPEEVMAERQAQAQAAQMQALGPSHIQAAGRIEQERLKNEKPK